MSRWALCLVSMMHANFHGKWPRGSWMPHHRPLGSAEKAGGLWVWTLSFPSRFCFFHCLSHVRIQPVLPPVQRYGVRLGPFLVLLSNPLFWLVRATQQNAWRGLSFFLGVRLRLPWRAQHRAVTFPRPSCQAGGGSSHSPTRKRRRRS